MKSFFKILGAFLAYSIIRNDFGNPRPKQHKIGRRKNVETAGHYGVPNNAVAGPYNKL
jgi:hypothetical protein